MGRFGRLEPTKFINPTSIASNSSEPSFERRLEAAISFMYISQIRIICVPIFVFVFNLKNLLDHSFWLKNRNLLFDNKSLLGCQSDSEFTRFNEIGWPMCESSQVRRPEIKTRQWRLFRISLLHKFTLKQGGIYTVTSRVSVHFNLHGGFLWVVAFRPMR